MDLNLSQPELGPWHPQMRPSAHLLVRGGLCSSGHTEVQLTCGRLQSQCFYCSLASHSLCTPPPHGNPALESGHSFSVPGTSDFLGPNIPLPP